MAWIEFHPGKIKKLKKFSDLRRVLQWNVNETLGFLGSLWGEVIDLREDGNISGWNPAYICDLTGIGIDPERVWDALVSCGWIDAATERVLVHDWLDTAGKFLAKKYSSSNKERLIEIWALHGKRYGSEPQADGLRTERGPTLPFLSPPPQTKDNNLVVSPKNGAPTPEDLLSLWNKTAHPNLPRVRFLTGKRKTHAKCRLEEHPEQAFWESVLEKVNRSPLCRGESAGNWKASFDWILNENNLAKILEGNYDPEKRR